MLIDLIQQNKGELGSPSGGAKRYCCVNPIST